MSILHQKKDTESYLKRIENEPKRTVENRKLTIANFSKFSQEIHHLSPETLCQELIKMKSSDGEEKYSDLLFDILQEWINWNISNGLGAYTVQTRFSTLRSYLYYLGIKTANQDVKQLLKFPKKIKEEKQPLKKNQLRDLVLAQYRYPKRQALYLACSSSGMRLGEALNIKKKDLDFSQARIMVRIRPEYTKTREGRTTFLSKECQEKIQSYIDKLEPDSLVFSTSTKESRIGIETRALARAVERLGIDKRYESNNFRKITSHSFRAYFFTLAARKHGENYAHRLTGHGGYLIQYDRMTEEEKLSKYIELESELVVFDQTKNEIKIKRLEEENDKINELKDEIKKLKENQAKQDRKILDSLRKKGLLPSSK